MKNETASAWLAFREAGLLWFTNTILHGFGYAIVFTYEENKLIEVAPARIPYRGFSPQSQETGFKRLHQYLLDNIETINNETNVP